MWIARNKDGTLVCFNDAPKYKFDEYFVPYGLSVDEGVIMPSDADEKLLGRHIEFEDGSFGIY